MPSREGLQVCGNFGSFLLSFRFVSSSSILESPQQQKLKDLPCSVNFSVQNFSWGVTKIDQICDKVVGMAGHKFKQPCMDCGKLSRNGSRCEEHGAAVNRYADFKKAERKRLTGQYGGDYRKRAKEVRESATICWLCGEGARRDDPWQADHVVPGDRYSVLAPAHRSCNAARGNKPLG